MTTATDAALPDNCEVHRGALLHFLDDPGNDPEPIPGSVEFLEDGLLVVHDGKVLLAGPAEEWLPRLPGGVPVSHWQDGLIVPGFIDTHVHMPQLGVMASYGAQLLDCYKRSLIWTGICNP